MALHSDYTSIPLHRFNDLRNQSVELLKAADEYYKMNEKIWEMEKMLKVAKEERDLLEKKYYSKCKHDYRSLPREYQSPREWECTICGHSV